MHHFDLMLQHGEATDRHSDGAIRTGHLHGFRKGNIPMGWNVKGRVAQQSTLAVEDE